MLEVGEVHAGPGDLPGVVAQVSTDQLTKNRVKEEQTLENEQLGGLQRLAWAVPDVYRANQANLIAMKRVLNVKLENLINHFKPMAAFP